MNNLGDGQKKTACKVCPRRCLLAEGQLGFCRARRAHNGNVLPENYGKITSLALDPIEKKPLYHFSPGSFILSAGSFGCNMRCPFCQNYEISQADSSLLSCRQSSPEELVTKAVLLKSRVNIGIAFTYNEPGVGYEFVRDTARLAGAKGLKNVMVTNGYLNRPILEELLPYMDAFNIDLKCFTAAGYKAMGGALEPVKDTIARAAESAHVEITTLAVPGLSDRKEEMKAQAAWLASLSPEIPLHISRYFPCWQAVEKPTHVETLQGLAEVAGQYLKHVHLGNV